MAAYTIEDIELIRRKSGISYQEAVALLDYHNGNVARALVDLERNGRIGGTADKTAEQASGSVKGASGASGKVNVTVNKGAIMNLVHKLYRARVKVKKGETPIINLSVLFSILGVLISPHLVIIGVIICLVLGYKFSIDKHDTDFDADNLERMVRSAADNVKASVSDFAKGFQEGNNQPVNESAPKEDAATRSYYANKPAAASAAYHKPEVPTLNVPVQVESQDGAVTMENETDGYSSATIE